MEPITPHDATNRIKVEFSEMPDLNLTQAQVRRLCDLPQQVCDAALASLVLSGFLRKRSDGLFLRYTLGGDADGIIGPRSLATVL